MKRNFAEALENRRSYYQLGSDSPVMDTDIIHVIREAVKYVPSAFNSQSTRIVLLLEGEHRKLWEIVKQTLKKITPVDVYVKTENKINTSFASGHGTVLFFEDSPVVKNLEESYPLYAKNFAIWSQHTSAMHQLAIWTMLEDLGLGASLQHYNPLIDEEVHRTWHLPKEWVLVAQLPFGMPLAAPEPKKFKPLEDRIKVFR